MRNAIPLLPGIVKDDSELESENRYIDGDKVRFRLVGKQGLPEPIGGWENASSDTVIGKARSLTEWEDLEGQKHAAIGTHRKLYVYKSGLVFDTTPIRDDSATSGTLTDPVATTDGSTTVSIAHTAHGLLTDDYAYLQADAVGGVTLGGTGTLSSGSLITVENSDMVVVSETAHGIASGDYVTFASASATNGIPAGDINKTHRVYVLTADKFQFQADTKATSSGTGGGTPTYTHFEGFPVTKTDDDNYTIKADTASSSTTGGGTTSWIYDISGGRENSTASAGYSTGTYSSGYYSLPSNETDLRARVWHLSNYGENLIANHNKGPLYRWTNNVSQPAAQIAATDAPVQNTSHFVTPERFLVTLGTEDAATSTWDAMLVAWATQEGGFTTGDWTPAATNTAGDYKLSEGSRIIRGLSMPFASLIWTDTALYQMRYLRDTTFVFGFDLAGTGCGLIGPNAAVRAGGAVYWLSSSRNFYIWGGDGLQVLQCPVREWLFDNLAPVQEDLIYAGGNSKHNEVWWFYPDRTTNENYRYVAYNYLEGHWTIGTFEITAWADRGVLQYPLAVHADGSVKLHERGGTVQGDALSGYAESGYFDLDDGDRLMFIREFLPDFKDMTGGVDVTITSKLWPHGTETVHSLGTAGPNTQKLNCRIKARQAKLKLEWDSAPASWRMGRPTVDVQPSAARK